MAEDTQKPKVSVETVPFPSRPATDYEKAASLRQALVKEGWVPVDYDGQTASEAAKNPISGSVYYFEATERSIVEKATDALGITTPPTNDTARASANYMSRNVLREVDKHFDSNYTLPSQQSLRVRREGDEGLPQRREAALKEPQTVAIHGPQGPAVTQLSAKELQNDVDGALTRARYDAAMEAKKAERPKTPLSEQEKSLVAALKTLEGEEGLKLTKGGLDYGTEKTTFDHGLRTFRVSRTEKDNSCCEGGRPGGSGR